MFFLCDIIIIRVNNRIGDIVKKKKKGFTLVELLAVVVILGLLVALTFPAVSKYINETRKESYDLHEADMKVATSNMMSECVQNNVDGCVPESGNSRVVTLDYLVENKYSEVVKDPENTDLTCDVDNSYVVVTNTGTDSVKLDYQVCLVCSEYKSSACNNVVETPECDADSDLTNPTCGDIVGESTIWTNKDRVISVDCNDEGCGCEKNTFYNTYTESTKTSDFIIKDKAGNETKCNVNVYVDKEKPTCTLKIDSYGVSGNDGWYGGSAPVVTFENKTDSLSNIATYGLGTSKNNYDFNKDNTYEVAPGISMIYGYVKDEAGNIGTCSIEVKYDPTKPIGDVSYGYQVYPKDDISSKSGSIISFNNITGEYGDIIGAKVYLSSNSNGISTTLKNGSSTLANRTISSGVTEMLYTFTKNTYNNLSIDFGTSTKADLVTKIELITDHLLDDDSVFFTNKDIRLYINSKDSISGSSSYLFDDGNWQSNNYNDYSSNMNFVAKIKDVSGNISDNIVGSINNIDKMKPTCVLKRNISPFIDSKDWYKDTVTVSFETYFDRAETSTNSMSDIRDYSFNANGLGDNKSSVQSDATDGTLHTGYVVDKAGNIGSCYTNIKLDKVNPTAGTITMKKDNNNGSTISNGGMVNSNVYISLNNGSDTGGIASGHYTTKYEVKKGSAVVTNSTTGTNTYTEEGSYTVTVITTDNSGRTSSNTYTFLIDKTKPSCGSITGESTSWINTSRKISVGCSDSSSLCSKTSFERTWTTSTKTDSITISDNAGNSRNCPVNVYLDVDAPTCTVTGGSSEWTSDNIVVYGTCNDTGGSDCKESISKTYSSNTNTTSASPGTVYDNAGNYKVCDGVTVKVDKCTAKSPTCSDVGSWSACSNKCGDGTKTIATTCQDYSTYGSGFKCGNSYSSSRSEKCTGTDCVVEVPFTSCPSCEDLFGSAQSTSGGGNGSYAFAYPAYGKFVTGLSSYSCYAYGGTYTDSSGNKYCKRTKGYERICYTDACGGWKGKTASYMLDNGAFGSCPKCSRYWCECSRWD